jgi:hypothetical protein
MIHDTWDDTRDVFVGMIILDVIMGVILNGNME